MLRLFFSLSSDLLFIAILENDKCLANIQQENKRQHSENFFFYLKEVLAISKISLSQIKEVYFTSSPGGQTGIRISLAFIATWQTINCSLDIYYINSLLFQAEKENVISLLTIDSKANKFHVAVYQDKKCLLTPKIISKEELEQLKKKFISFNIFQDFSQVKFLKIFFLSKNYFQKLKNVNELL